MFSGWPSENLTFVLHYHTPTDPARSNSFEFGKLYYDFDCDHSGLGGDYCLSNF